MDGTIKDTDYQRRSYKINVFVVTVALWLYNYSLRSITYKPKDINNDTVRTSIFPIQEHQNKLLCHNCRPLASIDGLGDVFDC